MLDAIKRMLAGSEPAAPARGSEAADQALRVAACALLLELAHADGEFSTSERVRIEEALVRHFGVDPEAARELMAIAEKRRGEASDLYQFTSVITRDYDEGQRMVLAEVLWGIVYADGELSSHETYLMRKLGNLLDLRPGYLSEARKRAHPGPDDLA
jgi:uncharacterized tellurite resistance protein B-like protein